jgi:hypothetical protein
MGFVLKRAFLVGFLPGFPFVAAVIFACKGYDVNCILALGEKLSVPFGIGLVVACFLIGQVFDSFRDWFVESWRKKHVNKLHKKRRQRHRKDVNWDYFYHASKENIEKLDNNFYIWYALNVDLVISLIATGIFVCIFKREWVVLLGVCIALLFSITPLWKDANDLRKEIAKYTQNPED